MKMPKLIDAWWFSTGKTLPHGDGRRIAIGRTHKVEGTIIPCNNGLHASVKPLDALQYAPGPIVWRVRMGGTGVDDGDKLAASERTYIGGGIDVSDTLRLFARQCALDVVHLWDAPDIVIRYLKTGDESIRAAARAAAWDARAAAGAAAWDAAWAAAWDVRDAARDAWDAAWDDAWAAAWDARDAAGAAAWDARDAAWDAAWAAARAKHNRRLVRLLNAAIK